MPPTRSHKPPPRWLPWIVPGARGLESNPLYLRLSGRAFPRRPGFLRAQSLSEFSRPPTNFVTGLGLPFTMLIGSTILGMALSTMTGPPVSGKMTSASITILLIVMLLGFCQIVGLFWLIARAASRGRANSVKLFLENSGRLPWGEGLYLSLLRAEEIDDAVLGALLERDERNVRSAVLWIAILPAACVFVVWGSVDSGPEVFAGLLVYLRWAIPFALAGYAWFFVVQALNVAAEAQAALSVAQGRWGRRFVNALGRAAAFFLIHVPGAAAVIGIAVAIGRNGWQGHPVWSEFDYWMAWMACISLFAYSSAAIGLAVCRVAFVQARGRIGTAMGVMVRRQYGD